MTEDDRVARVDRVYPAGEPDPIERGNDATADCRLLRRADHSNRPRLKQCFKLHRLPLCRSNDATVHGSAQGEYSFERAASGDAAAIVVTTRIKRPDKRRRSLHE